MCGQKLTCSLLLGALGLIVSAGKTPGIGVWTPPAAEFVISYTDGVSAEHALYSNFGSLEDLAPARIESPLSKGDPICG